MTQAAATTETSPVKIMVVDDEPDVELLVRQKYRRQIRERTYEFVFAGDGVEALERLEDHPDVDIVLTDLNMPRMDGLSLLAEIQQLDRLLKVIIVSAYGDMANIRTAMNRGAFDFITKPIDFDDLSVTIEKTQRELATLQQATRLKRQLGALQRELEIARQIQTSALPNRFPAFPDRPEFDLHATMLPAHEVGGDFYDYFMVDDDHLGFAVGDVSGKGIGAALMMAVTRTMLRATALQDASPAACLTHVNRVLFPETMARMFVTVVYGTLDVRSGAVCYANAGHTLPYVVPAAGDVRAVPRSGGLGLVLAPDFPYEDRTLTLAPGDALVLYTDGVTEATAADGELFAEQRLADALAEVPGTAPAEMIRHVRCAVRRFSDDRPQRDDLTMLALQYRG